MRIKVTADSTCDLPESLTAERGITIVPLYVNRGEETLRDGVDIRMEDVFAFMEATGELCKTSALNIADYQSVWTELRREYDAIIHISISSGLSVSHANACLAAAAVGGVWVVDSLSLSTGSGHLVLDAAALARTGAAPADIAAELRRRAKKLEVSFVIDTLAYLHRGGRCSALAVLGANMLGLRPCIEMRDGVLGVGRKYRGSLEKCFVHYIEDRLCGRSDIDTRRIFFTGTALPAATRELVRRTILDCLPFEEVIGTEAGCTIASHCGPGTMGILFYRK